MATAANLPKIEIPIGCSCGLKVFYICVFSAVLTAVFFAPVDVWLKAIFLVATVLATIPAFSQIRLIDQLQSIRVKGEGLELSFLDDKVPVQLVGNGIVSQILVTFSCKRENQNRWWSLPMHFVVFPDAATPEDYRLLRMLVKNGV
ncbi:MAG: hypothetical protein K6L76_04545 [Agarilytica sp.]